MAAQDEWQVEAVILTCTDVDLSILQGNFDAVSAGVSEGIGCQDQRAGIPFDASGLKADLSQYHVARYAFS